MMTTTVKKTMSVTLPRDKEASAKTMNSPTMTMMIMKGYMLLTKRKKMKNTRTRTDRLHETMEEEITMKEK